MADLSEVQRYLKLKDFYQILGVPKTAEESEIKKAYRKLALKFHPDKCQVEGAQAVFKKIAQAYDCLTTPDKRAFYDRTGSDEPQAYQQQYQQQDFDAQDIFNFMFGGGAGPQFGGQQYRRRQQNHHAGQGQRQGGQGLGSLMQLLPLFILLFSGQIFNFFQEDPAYSFQRTHTYSVRRVSLTLQIDYYVDKYFEAKVMKDRAFLQKTEYELENTYVQNLRVNCQQNQQYKRQLLQQARLQRQQYYKDLYEKKARHVDMSHCEKLDYFSRQNIDLDMYM